MQVRLGHKTVPGITNIYKILKCGCLRPGSKTEIVHMWDFEQPSEYIYLTIGGTFNNSNLILDSGLLTENTSYLNKGWVGTPRKDSIKIDNQPSKKELSLLLLNWNKQHPNHEVLVVENIDLTKWLRHIVLYKRAISKARKTYEKLMKLLNTTHPAVTIEIRD